MSVRCTYCGMYRNKKVCDECYSDLQSVKEKLSKPITLKALDGIVGQKSYAGASK